MRRERGASLVELALILPIVAILVFGTVDLVRAYRLNIRLEAAAREGAAFAQLLPNDVVCSGAFNDIKDRVALEDPNLSSSPGYAVRAFYGPAGGPFTEYGSAPALCTSSSGTAVVVPGNRVQVRVESTFDVLTPLVEQLVGGTIDMSGVAEVEVQG